MRNHRLLTVAAMAGILAVGAACRMVDPERPTPQPDTTVYGNLLQVSPGPEGTESVVVRLRVAPPRLMIREQQQHGTPTPVVEEGLSAEIAAGPDTVVVLSGGRGLDDLPAGTELVALPVPGTTRMVGSSRILMDAQYLMDFESYRAWKLPLLGGSGEAEDRTDPGRINSAGIEHSPVPVRGGTVLYFTARLRRPWKEGMEWIGARRPGLPVPAAEGEAVERVFRTELGSTGWTEPVPVVFEGIGETDSVSLSWMDPGEARCLVTVRPSGGEPWVGAAAPVGRGGAWGPVERIEQLGAEDAWDAVHLAGSSTMLAFVSTRTGTGNPDILLLNPKAGPEPSPLDPRINTPASEWAPRVGPANELLFCRNDRQFLYVGGVARPVRLPGRFRSVLTEANPTRDGRWVFFCRPRLTPVELDQDIWVARWNVDGSFADPVPVDDWRP